MTDRPLLRVIAGKGQGADGGTDPSQPLPRERRLLWATMIVGVIVAGAGFCYKVAEFIFTLSAEEAKGFAEVPVLIYFVVATGWLLLLIWCFMTGKFVNQEAAKYEMLAQEEAYERRGE